MTVFRVLAWLGMAARKSASLVLAGRFLSGRTFGWKGGVVDRELRSRVDLRGVGRKVLSLDWILVDLGFKIERWQSGDYMLDIVRFVRVLDVSANVRDRAIVDWFLGLPVLVSRGSEAPELCYLVPRGDGFQHCELGLFCRRGRFMISPGEKIMLLGFCVNLPSRSLERRLLQPKSAPGPAGITSLRPGDLGVK